MNFTDGKIVELATIKDADCRIMTVVARNRCIFDSHICYGSHLKSVEAMKTSKIFQPYKLSQIDVNSDIPLSITAQTNLELRIAQHVLSFASVVVDNVIIQSPV